MFPIATVAFAVGIILADQGLVGVVAARAIGLGALATGLMCGRRPAFRALAAVLVIGSCGALALSIARERAGIDSQTEPRDVLVDGTVCASSGWGSSRSVDLCDCAAANPSDRSVPRRLRVFESVDQEVRAVLLRLRIGQRIRAQLRLTPIRPAANPGARDNRNSYARRGIGARASLRNAAMLVRISSRDRPGTNAYGEVAQAIASWRGSIGERLAAEGPGGGLARALVLGDRSTLPQHARDGFAQLGIGHLLAVSGLHVALVAGLFFAIVRWGCLRFRRFSAGRDPRRVALAGALAMAFVYGAMSGWGVPVRRALVFLAVACLAVAVRRPVGAVQVLSLAALPILIAEPHALFEMGAQLSFVASAGLLLARRRAGAEWMWGASLMRTSATAIAATAPWVAWHGGTVGVFGVAANLIAVPWVGMVVLPASLLAACAAALPETEPTRMLIGGVAQLGELTLLAVTSVASWLPVSAGGNTPSTWVLLCAGAISLLALSVQPTSGRVALSLAASALLAFTPPKAISPAPPRLVVFDVGQGDAILIQGRSGSVLVDAGRAIGDSFDMGRRVIVPGLAALGLSELDLVIASHADLDHRGGLEAVLEGVPTRELWLPRGTLELPDFRHLLEVAKRRGVRVHERGAGDSPSVYGDLRVVPIWPAGDAAITNRNDSSLVVRVEVRSAGEVSETVLLPGDLGMRAERALVESGVNLESTVLKVGHHGSRTSSTPVFLDSVQPAIALVSAPCHGRMGLPSALALDRLSETGAEVWWTGRSGAVIVGFKTHTRARVVEGWHSNVQCWAH
ncbi:MAG: DNA internalization-related competence protein ComEC/Rec2 [Deltaproteobacteria bacterium]|nr:DNA internalization-related competence protein ComEC/Rec2 [Deltaproteobacteria bacterium]